MNKIIIYTNETCPYCKQIKEELTKNNIEFENVVTTNNTKEWEEIIGLTGMPTVPTILYNNEYLVAGRDFSNPAHVVHKLKNFVEVKFDKITQLNERIKTLNYSMGTAFGKMDQILIKIENKLNIKENEHESTN